MSNDTKLRRAGADCGSRARELFENHLYQLRVKIDHMFVVLMFAQWLFAIVCALWLTPYVWNGAQSDIHPHVGLAALIGGLLTMPAAFAGILYPGRTATRHIIAICQVAFSSLLIHVTGGRIETHFHVFGSLAFLAAYRDWRVLVPATLFVAVDHIVRGVFWPETVFGITTPDNWRWLEHAGWVLFEDLWLVICCRQGIREVQDIARHSAELEQSHAALQQQTQALEESLHEREAIVEGALDAVVQMDGLGQITGWNSQATQVFGWLEHEALGKSFVDLLVAPVDHDRYTSFNLASIVNQRVEVQAIRRNGEVFPIELAITPIVSSGRTSFCAFLRDISDRRQAEERLKHAKEAAEAASHAKSLFLANMSHEIRTPLNAILGFTDILRSADHDFAMEERKSHLDAVHRSGTHLLAVINDILDLSKIEAGQMQYERIRFAPHQVIGDVLSLMRVRAAEKNLTLDARWVGRVPETIVSDPARLRQLLINLVGNAIKFTERGSVQILSRMNTTQELLQIEVIDTGVGIPSDKLESIFAPFAQADASVTRRFGGTGLGLSICRYMAAALGGEITAQSCEGQGSTFTVTVATGSLAGVKLLDTPPSEVLRAAAPVSDAPVRLTGMNILIVDDGETNRRLLQLLLTRAGATVQMAEHGLAAVERAAEDAFDAILMDMQMPIMDGYSATRELRARGLNTPVIALTAHAMAGEETKCLAAGCDAYLAKPVNRHELIQALGKFDTSSSSAQPFNQMETKTKLATAGELLVSELDLSDPEVRDIVSEFVHGLPHTLKDIVAAWESRDWALLDRAAHSLKGTAAMTGFSTLSAAAGKLEELSMGRDEGRIPQALTAVERVVGRIVSAPDHIVNSGATPTALRGRAM